jgi:two-component system nitrogen regulation sensor histidine kinase GlnL
MIDCESQPGNTCFTILLPVESTVIKHAIIQQ